MGVDLGTRRIGVAVSNRSATMAFPWGTLQRSGDPAADRRRLAAVVTELEGTTVVIGLPLSLDGSVGPAARAAQAEARDLEHELAGRGVVVEVFDERLTTVSALAALASGGTRGTKARRKVDGAAATVLLQAWLDSQ